MKINLIILGIASSFIIFNIDSIDSCFRFCDEDNYIVSSEPLNGSGAVCIVCDNFINSTQVSHRFLLKL